MSKLIVLLADGFEECEALLVVDILRRAGVETVMASIMGRLEVLSSRKIEVKADVLAEDVDYDSADMLFLPGGRKGSENLLNSELVKKWCVEFAKTKKLAAICAAPSVLARFGLLEGKKATSYPSVTDQLKGATVITDKVVTDGHITTSRGLGTAIDFGLAIAERFCGKDVAEDIARGIVYR